MRKQLGKLIVKIRIFQRIPELLQTLFFLFLRLVGKFAYNPLE